MVDSMVQFAKENWNILFVYFYAFGFVLEPEGIKKIFNCSFCARHL